MDNYVEWRQNKVYEGHISRLKTIQNGPSTYQQKINSAKITKNKLSSQYPQTHKKLQSNHQTKAESREKKRCATSASKEEQKSRFEKRLQTSSGSVKRRNIKMKIYFPAPLISGQESKLIKSALDSKLMPVKQKQHMLENYLLSRRILSAKTMIKTKNDAKAYEHHRKISLNLSRSRKISQAYATERTLQFKHFEEYSQRKNQIQIGKGKNIFDLTIKSILLIKSILPTQPHILYNLKLLMGRKKQEIRSLTHDELMKKNIRLRFKKSLMRKHPQIMVSIRMMRSNLEMEIGSFQLNLHHFQSEEIRLYRVMKGKSPIGTIQLQGRISFAQEKDIQW